jgi:putative colanic acid biosynthesis acetyltransferase WcaF
MADHSLLAGGVNCYNVGTITIGTGTIVSQGAHLCAASHDVADPAFPLLVRPITLMRQCWIAADAFVGPGVTVGEGAVLGARGAAFKNLDPWTVYRGNPAAPIATRSKTPFHEDGDGAAADL